MLGANGIPPRSALHHNACRIDEPQDAFHLITVHFRCCLLKLRFRAVTDASSQSLPDPSRTADRIPRFATLCSTPNRSNEEVKPHTLCLRSDHFFTQVSESSFSRPTPSVFERGADLRRPADRREDWELIAGGRCSVEPCLWYTS